MLTQADNDLLCRVGPGTPMGNLMRQYWMPAVRSDELPAPDCAPLRVKLLGEELVAWRNTDNSVGIMQNACPHRGASMFFGRNEENGLRCVYHGWKFDVTGACIDMPNEPAESNFKHKIRAATYPTRERNGVIWAYMGPRETPPPLPDIEANLLVTDPLQISVIHRPCNWMQGWEGEMDTAHAAFLHAGASKPEDFPEGHFNRYQYGQRAPKFSVLDTDFGTSYGAYRPAGDDKYYWRIAHMLFPFHAMIPTGALGEQAKVGMYVPMDDEHTMHWEIFSSGLPSLPNALAGSRQIANAEAAGALLPPRAAQQSGRATYVPTTTGWYGRFNIDQTMANDYLIDREAQRGWKTYTGIAGIRQQDMAVTESMGPIYNRTREHLGSTDALIIRTRKRMINAARALAEHGTIPPGVDQPEVYRQRSGEVILPRNVDWWEATKSQRETFVAVTVER